MNGQEGGGRCNPEPAPQPSELGLLICRMGTIIAPATGLRCFHYPGLSCTIYCSGITHPAITQHRPWNKG